ncbi:pistil-specific extensin-like protein [Canna indica]|uniref:Pistil-specific extensin-like protein n=1 Tax=Canna indica TaxID=4628 RepID=A0AAQ3KJE4_9LILI|nr:pistil-specific extensin-like protein [Canna indica]
MMTSWFMAAMAASMLLLNTWAADGRKYYDENVEVVHIDGKVMCQDCNQGWNEWVHGKPIKGAKVAVTCLDSRRRAVYHACDATDDKGEFDLVVSKHVHGKAIRPADCTVRLVSSPDPTCNVMTDFGGGKCGVKPHHPSVVQRGLVKYTVGPFFFTTPACEEPETSKPDDEDDD